MNSANNQIPSVNDNVGNDSGLGSELGSESDSDSGIESIFEGLSDILGHHGEDLDVQETTEEQDRLTHSFHQAQIVKFNAVIKQLQDKEMERAESQSLLDDFCRICRENERFEPFVSPCHCKGTLAMVHLSCLERWLAESDSASCELCSHRYTTVRTPRKNILKSVFHWATRVAWRTLLFDLVTLALFTPLAVVGTYFGSVASDAYYLNTPESPIARTATLSLISMMAAVDTFYLGWTMLRVKYHFYRWYSYWRRNSVVKVILPAKGDTPIARGETDI